MRRLLICFALLTLVGLAQSPLRVEVTLAPGLAAAPLNGRMDLFISKDPAREPRFQISDQINTQEMLGLNVERVRAGGPAAVFDAGVLGYPAVSLRDLPAGDYYVQALLNVYTTFHRADGHVVQLPMDQGEGQQYNKKPGNPYSVARKVHLDPQRGGVVRIELTQVIPPIPPPPDTPWIKHLRVESPLLSKFWGRPMYLGATVILPEGFETHPQAHYPVMVLEGHFAYDLANKFRRRGAGSLYDDWTSGKLPKMILMDIQHANPYYDDSYAVNSANVGPYGDAIVQELIPAVEKKFRGIGQSWARVTYGGSTGGWESLAQQIFYPDEYNGTWTFCPDPIDFRAYQIVNIYDDANSNWLVGPWANVPRPSVRRPDGTVVTTMERENHRELVLGDHGRSADQYNVWQAVFSPVGADGYPKEIWNPMTGVINHTVADYWKRHYDLRAWTQAHWSTLAPKLDGKIHIWVGDMDTYYLDNAVYLFQDMVEHQTSPKIAADFNYGRKQPHCYDGTYRKTTAEQAYMPAMAARMVATAPAGADMSWRYAH